MKTLHIKCFNTKLFENYFRVYNLKLPVNGALEIQNLLLFLRCDANWYNIVACRQKARMIEEIRVYFLGNEQRSRDNG
jgi:hypothetical protein